MRSKIPIIIICVGVVILATIGVLAFKLGIKDNALPPPVEEKVEYTGPVIEHKTPDTVTIDGEEFYLTELKYSRDTGDMTDSELAAAYIDTIETTYTVEEAAIYTSDDASDTEQLEDAEIQETDMGPAEEIVEVAYRVNINFIPDSEETSDFFDTVSIRYIDENGNASTVDTSGTHENLSFYVYGEFSPSNYIVEYGSTDYGYTIQKELSQFIGGSVENG